MRKRRRVKPHLFQPSKSLQSTSRRPLDVNATGKAYQVDYGPQKMIQKKVNQLPEALLKHLCDRNKKKMKKMSIAETRRDFLCGSLITCCTLSLLKGRLTAPRQRISELSNSNLSRLESQTEYFIYYTTEQRGSMSGGLVGYETCRLIKYLKGIQIKRKKKEKFRI